MNHSPTTSFSLPALKSLGNLAGRQPTIVIDNREQAPLVFERLPSVRATLLAGDYSVQGLQNLFSVERKTLNDCVQCCSSDRDRFEAQLHRLRGYRFKRLLIVGTEAELLAANYHSRMSPRAVLASLYAFQARYDIPLVFSPSPSAAARLLELWCFYFAREIVEAVNNLSRANP